MGENTVEACDWQGIAALRVTTPQACAVLALHGGQLLSFVPLGQQDLLWLSPDSRLPPQPIRGGVPVCWPYFGRQGQAADLPQHGFARTAPWRVLEQRIEASAVTLQLALPAIQGTALQLTQTLRIGAELRQSLHTHNRGGEPVTFTQALHSYLRVGNAEQVRVQGVQGLDYSDKHDGREHRQTEAWHLHDPRDPGRCDRVYHQAAGDYLLLDPVLRRRIQLTTTGSRSLVLWNPGATGVAALGDVPAAAWRDFVCVEAANAGHDTVTLLPGQTHVLEQTLRALPL